LINGKRILELMDTLGIAGSIGNLAPTFAAAATDLESGREIWLREGAIAEAVRASISIPGIFNPVSRDGRWLADGALVNPVPVSLCRALGADIIIAVNVSAGSITTFGSKATSARRKEASAGVAQTLSEQTPELLRQPLAATAGNLFQPAALSPGYVDVLLNALNIMEDQITRSRLAGEPPHLLLAPRVALEPLEFHRGSEAIAAGFEAMDEAAPALRRLLA
jgi:NTE family protein